MEKFIALQIMKMKNANLQAKKEKEDKRVFRKKVKKNG